MTRYALSSDDLLILRDGRPFGDAGAFGGTALDWPLPQTLAGMCRTSLGFGRSVDYFNDAANVRQIQAIGIKRFLPCIVDGGGFELLMPTPADLVLTETIADPHSPAAHHLCPLTYRETGDGEGTDLDAPLWLYATPSAAIKEKPAELLRFIRWRFAEDYLRGRIPENGAPVDLGGISVAGTVRDFRIHSAIDPDCRTVDEGRLYGEAGIYLKHVLPEHGPEAKQGGFLAEYGSRFRGDIMLGFEIDGLGPDERPGPTMYLGGERRRVELQAPAPAFPQCPDCLNDQALLKLVLITHGDFGSWAPSWLVPGADPGALDWVREPLSGVRLRLRSAVVKGWDPVSGWDYAARRQKAFRKLVKPGSVYLVELQNPAESGELARALWGESLCPPDSRACNDGYGQVLIARTIQ